MEYAKLFKGNTFDVQVAENDEHAQLLLSEGYIPTQEVNTLPDENLYTICFYSLTFDEDKKVYKKTWHTNIGEIVGKQIETLKQQLADTDYKVIKNMEYQMAIMTSTEPNQVILDLYDPQELHNERQALRDKINELEQLLKRE